MPACFDRVDVLTRPQYRRHGIIGHLIEAAATVRTVRRVRTEVLATRSAGFEIGIIGILARASRRRFVHSIANLSDFNFKVVAPKILDRLLYECGVRAADVLVVQTAEQREACTSKYRRASVVIRNIVEESPPASEEPEAFLWAGRAVWYKRPLEYVELARAMPAARFWMIPLPSAEDDALLLEVRQAASTVPNLELFEPITRDDLGCLLGRTVATVNTSDFEGMSNVILEGWARGVPALSLYHDPDGLIVGQSLGSFASGNWDAFVESGKTLWASRRRRPELSARCREYVRREHSEDAIAEAWGTVLRRVPRAGAVGPSV
jgi:glycosyltransferase involved in cell wall biosynthesis